MYKYISLIAVTAILSSSCAKKTETQNDSDTAGRDQAVKSTGSNFVDCQVKLYDNGGLTVSDAAKFCQKNSTPEFVSCQVTLYDKGGFFGSDAAEYCQKNSTPELVSCQVKLFNKGGFTGSDAAKFCQKNSNPNGR